MPPVFGPVSPSPTRLWSCAATSGAHAFAVAQHQERNFFALQEFFQHDALSGLAQHFSAQHVGSDRRGFFLGLGDDHALTRGESVGLHHDGRAEVDKRIRQLSG